MGRLRVDRICGATARLVLASGRVVLDACHVADRPVSRLVGLLGTRRLADGEGLAIRPCASVHTFGMRYPIACAFVGADGRVLRVVDPLPPGRGARARGASWVVEAAAGTFGELTAGDLIELVPEPAAR